MGTVRTISLQDNEAQIANLKLEVGRLQVVLHRREQYINELKAALTSVQSEIATLRSKGKTYVLKKASA
jgi:hypothetical protein